MTAIQGFESRADWLAARRCGIGASESAVILGLNPYQSPAELYLRKIGEMPEQDESWAMKLGTHMEGLLQAEYERRYATRLETQIFVKHPGHPCLFATLDGLTPEGVVVEFKTASWPSSREWGEEETDEIPWHYLVQVQHQLEVTELDTCHVFASLDKGEPRRFVVRRNPLVGEMIVTACEMFWRAVCDRKPPANLFRGDDCRIMHLLYPEAEGAIGLGDDVAALVDRRDRVKGFMKDLEDERDGLKMQILAAMGPFAAASLPDGRLLTRKITEVAAQTIERRGYSFVDLRVRKARVS
jgi:putative phage-type endonuclease